MIFFTYYRKLFNFHMMPKGCEERGWRWGGDRKIRGSSSLAKKKRCVDSWSIHMRDMKQNSKWQEKSRTFFLSMEKAVKNMLRKKLIGKKKENSESTNRIKKMAKWRIANGIKKKWIELGSFSIYCWECWSLSCQH